MNCVIALGIVSLIKVSSGDPNSFKWRLAPVMFIWSKKEALIFETLPPKARRFCTLHAILPMGNTQHLTKFILAGLNFTWGNIGISEKQSFLHFLVDSAYLQLFLFLCHSLALLVSIPFLLSRNLVTEKQWRILLRLLTECSNIGSWRKRC